MDSNTSFSNNGFSLSFSPDTISSDRNREALVLIGKKYPSLFKNAEKLFAIKGDEDLPLWADWCLLPIAGWLAAISGNERPVMTDFYALQTAPFYGTWRYTQSIYKIAPNLLSEIIKTPVVGDIPVEILYMLPEWCIYVDTSGIGGAGLTLNGNNVIGFFAMLEDDQEAGTQELRLLIEIMDDYEDRIVQTISIIHIGKWTIAESIKKAEEQIAENIKKHSAKEKYNIESEFLTEKIETKINKPERINELSPFLSILLYICSDSVEYDANTRPAKPTPKNTRKYGNRLYPASKIRTWKLGGRTSEALRSNLSATTSNSKGRKPTIPHIRRAHWHTFYAGPRSLENREVRVKWIPPTLVAMPNTEE